MEQAGCHSAHAMIDKKNQILNQAAVLVNLVMAVASDHQACFQLLPEQSIKLTIENTTLKKVGSSSCSKQGAY
jgi:hypothetical protein